MGCENMYNMLDPSGVLLAPGFHGENCAGSVNTSEHECCCDECDFYLLCFTDWRTMDINNENYTTKKT